MIGGAALMGGGEDAVFIGTGTHASAYSGTTQVTLPAGAAAGDLCISITWSDRNSVVSALIPSATWSGGVGFAGASDPGSALAPVVRYRVLTSGDIAAGHMDWTGGDNGSGGAGGYVVLYVIRGATAAGHKQTVSQASGFGPGSNLALSGFTPASNSAGALVFASTDLNLGSVITAPIDWNKRGEFAFPPSDTAVVDLLMVDAIPTTGTFLISGYSGGTTYAALLEILK